ncbi:MAG: NfeD family protein, partial [Phycisphaerae bacterium]|nr:NfeD family protein [Phycisphaerae bacterium]
LILAFQENPATGFLFLAIAAVCVPTTVILGLNLFPKTPFGKRLILKPATSASPTQSNAAVAEQDFSLLLGKIGKTLTPLRPSGSIEIDNQRYSAVAEGEIIDDDVDIVVIKVEGNSVVVEPKNS